MSNAHQSDNAQMNRRMVDPKEKKAGVVHEVVPDVHFSHEVAEHEISVTKLPPVSVLVSLHTWQSVFLQIPP